MGAVYLAHDPRLDRLIALKVPRPLAEDAVGWRERFETEARAAATLNHPNICPVFEVGEVDEQPYLTMAYIEGETLAARLRREGPLTVSESVDLIREIARAMAEAHDRGIVHRDLKPSNIMIDARGRPIIMDFGLALRLAATDDLRLTLSGVAMGTPAYMPPEQAGGDQDVIGPSADVYTLGVILFELLTGRVPFEGRSFGKLLAQIERDPPVNPSSINPDVDPMLDSVVFRAMAKAPEDRFETAGGLADALDRHARGERQPIAGPVTPTATFTPSEERARRAAKSGKAVARRPRWAALVAGLLGLGLLGTVLYLKTDYGQLVVELSDPTAAVALRVNGQEVTLDPNGDPVRIRAGEGQMLEVTAAGFATVSRRFDLKRGGKTVVRVRLEPIPKVAGRPPAPAEAPQAPPPPPPPSKPVAFPAQPTVVELPGWRILADATREDVRQWLDDRQKNNHAVTWLDVVQIGDQPLFAAVAALDDRQTGWKAFLDLSANEVNNVPLLAQRFNVHEYNLKSLSGYAESDEIKVAALFWPLDTGQTLTGSVGIVPLHDARGYLARPNLIARLVRPFPTVGDQTLCALYMESVLTPKPRPSFAMIAPEELTDTLAAYRADGYRPLSAVGIEEPSGRRFATTLRKNPGKSAWEIQRDLTAGELRKQAVAMADQKLIPASITAYPWDGAVRYAVVWTADEEANRKE